MNQCQGRWHFKGFDYSSTYCHNSNLYNHKSQDHHLFPVFLLHSLLLEVDKSFLIERRGCVSKPWGYGRVASNRCLSRTCPSKSRYELSLSLNNAFVNVLRPLCILRLEKKNKKQHSLVFWKPNEIISHLSITVGEVNYKITVVSKMSFEGSSVNVKDLRNWYLIWNPL